MAGVLFEDIFNVKDIDPEGKKFDRETTPGVQENLREGAAAEREVCATPSPPSTNLTRCRVEERVYTSCEPRRPFGVPGIDTGTRVGQGQTLNFASACFGKTHLVELVGCCTHYTRATTFIPRDDSGAGPGKSRSGEGLLHPVTSSLCVAKQHGGLIAVIMWELILTSAPEISME
uniref:Uncharacterized protein n=1 Tax=Timema poppense TaxID=170557 RepID=A0A7R9H895_TIMPO|nr:unnamed protein product [Timema poppensis]